MMHLSSFGTDHFLCFIEDDVDMLVDLCHACAFPEQIALFVVRRDPVDPHLWL